MFFCVFKSEEMNDHKEAFTFGVVGKRKLNAAILWYIWRDSLWNVQQQEADIYEKDENSWNLQQKQNRPDLCKKMQMSLKYINYLTGGRKWQCNSFFPVSVVKVYHQCEMDLQRSTDQQWQGVDRGQQNAKGRKSWTFFLSETTRLVYPLTGGDFTFDFDCTASPLGS